MTRAVAAEASIAPRRTWALARWSERHFEAIAVTSIVAIAAVARFINLPARLGWDSDQGADATAVFNAVNDGRLPSLGPLSSVRSFHHGALYYDLLLPAGWLGHGDPIWLAAEIALLGVLVVLAAWWLARSIAGPQAGIAAAILAATSTAFLRLSIGVWNPFLIAPGAALALLGMWEGWRTGRGWWWVAAAVGVDVAAQAHVAASIAVVPLVSAYVIAAVKAPPERRPRLLAWGVASVAVVAVTIVPLLSYEIANGFPESRGIAGYLLLGRTAAPPEVTLGNPVDWPVFVRVPFAALRILAWPLTGWPQVDRIVAFLPAVAAAMGLAVGLVSRTLAVRRRSPREAMSLEGSVLAVTPREQASGAESVPGAGSRRGTEADRPGVYLVAGSLLALVLLAGFGLKDVAQIQTLPTEQYHSVADVFVIVAAGIVLGSVWRARSTFRGRHVGPAVYTVVIAALVAWNVAWWPPMQSADGGWPAAQAAARTIETLSNGRSIGFASLPSVRPTDAYRYPLQLDGARLVAPADAEVIVLLCDSTWVEGCHGSAEEAWRTANGGDSLKLLEAFSPAPDRTLTVYARQH